MTPFVEIYIDEFKISITVPRSHMNYIIYSASIL